MTGPTAMRLSELAAAAQGRVVGGDATVSGLALDSRRVAPGDLFFALPGGRADGMQFVADARARGAVAVCASQPVEGVPTLVATDPRAVLGRISATFHGDPASRLRLVGITGTLGKTSTALLVLSALGASGRGVGVVGSLGVKARGVADPTIAERLPDTNGMTTPDAPTLHGALRLLVDAGVETVAMEVTSHALAQRRVDGICLQLGLLTNLVPDEHLEFHPSAEHYLRTKARFFDLLGPGAPIVANADDALVRDMVTQALARTPRPVVWVSMDARDGAHVRVESLRWDGRGAAFDLVVAQPLPRLDGGEVEAARLPLVLPVFGVQQVGNALLAATAALIAGASPDGLAAAVAEVEPMKRRMQVVRRERPLVVDDTSGNPETLRAVFESARALRHARLRVAFGIRGTRGREINRRLAMTLAGLVTAHADHAPITLVVTASDDVADERNRVLPEERETFLQALDAARAPYTFEPTLAAATERLADETSAEDLVLLLGAQGMDESARLMLAALARRGMGG